VFGEVLLYPNLGEPLSKSENSELRLYLTAYAPQNSSLRKLTLEFLRNGQVLGQVASDLPVSDSNRPEPIHRHHLASAPSRGRIRTEGNGQRRRNESRALRAIHGSTLSLVAFCQAVT